MVVLRNEIKNVFTFFFFFNYFVIRKSHDKYYNNKLNYRLFILNLIIIYY